MGDASEEGWQTVLPTSHHGVERLSRSQLESYERQILKEWESSRGHWSGVGKHTPAADFAEAKKLHHRFRRHDTLGSGTYGIVEKVTYTHNNRSICLARKWIQYRRGRTIQMLREEANVMEKLDHEHIVKLAGTYCTRHNELYLLLWPVAVCNLDNLFNDLDSLRTGQGDRNDILKRLEALDVADVRALQRHHRHGGELKTSTASRGNCPLKYLQQVIGCITHAVAYCHESNIRHLDLKPSNILLSPGRVYLADFGIARDVNDRDHTMTFGLQGTPKWRAPEVCDPDDEWSMKAADVYSLGLVLLNISTLLYGAQLADFDRVVDELNPRSRAQKLSQYYPKLEAMALATQVFQDTKAHTFAPKHIVNLMARMLSSDPSQRPNASQVDAELAELGGIEQIYHSPCCKRSSRYVTEHIDMRYKVVADERDRLQADFQRMAKRLEVLEGKDETYEERLKNERKAHAQNIAHLQEQLDKERKERVRLDGLLAERRQRPGIPRPGRNISGGHDAGPGLFMRTRPHVYTLPVAASPASFPSASAPAPKAQMKPFPVHAVRNEVDSPTRALITIDTNIPSPIPSPNPNAAGSALRSRGSGSRLPRLVNPSTPRSSTPSLQRDPSLTDSTQCSMSSSTFSRLSRLSRESESEVGSPGVRRSTSTNDGKSLHEPSRQDIDADRGQSLGTVVGLGLHANEEFNAMATIKPDSIKDHASVVSSGAPGTTSPVLTASALSSPRSVKADLHPVAGDKVPPLPLAKSWADVARRERRS
ncbi:kinase-like protein [Coniochaeta ligniaria NRRL 30616]|uniref:Kinase-like protein n=1 Tax=Coniochaeta ligniaria NRRL 30616 TaxID=1408157 RepID=A0A1J7IDC9_9PEZI|nr:kinase-like protein [Coniochaeta ligniaria NRRL 30616]